MLEELHKEFLSLYAPKTTSEGALSIPNNNFSFDQFLMVKLLQKLDEIYQDIPNENILDSMVFSTSEVRK